MSGNSLDFNRWSGPRRGVAARRWAITATGLRLLWRTRFFKALIFLGWVAGLLVAVAGFVFAQTLSEGGWLSQLAASGGPRVEAVMRGFSALLLLYPDLLVTGMFKLVFWVHSQIGLLLSLVAMTLLVPQLITRDRATQALTIYLARPLTSRDYLIGKLGIIAGVLLLLWTGPLLFGWALGMLLLPDWVFFQYSLPAMGAALTFNAVALVVVGAVAFGVSALGRTAASARLGWIGLWILLGIIARHPVLPDWVRHASFSYNLTLVRDETFAMGAALADAAGVMPLLSTEVARELQTAAQRFANGELTGAAIGLGVLVIGALALLLGKVKPE